MIKKVSTLQTTSVRPSSKNIYKVCNKSPHALRKCFSFNTLKVPERINKVKSLGYCINCFSYSHTVNNCTSDGRCENCKEMHNTLLCLKASQNQSQPNSTGLVPTYNNGQFQNIQAGDALLQSDLGTYSTMVSEPEETESIVFPTALFRVVSSTGHTLVLRAMIDKCCDASYITEQAVKNLNSNNWSGE